jgi:hypothetical protein
MLLELLFLIVSTIETLNFELPNRPIRKLGDNTTAWTEGGVLLFPSSESRTEGGRRQESDESIYTWQSVGGSGSKVVRGSCRLPRFSVIPGPVKSVVKNSPDN